MEQITKTASDLNEKAENRYQLVYEIADLAKKMVDESLSRKVREDVMIGGYEHSFDPSIKKEKPVQHAIMVKASESDDNGLVG